MNTKLQELTEKIFQEGIEQAQEESDKLLKESKSKAEQIVKEAERKAEQVLMDAEEEANSFKKNMTSELNLAAKQLVGKLRQDVQNLLAAEVVGKPVSTTLKEPETLRAILVEVAKNIPTDSSQIQLKANGQNQSLQEILKADIARELNKEIEFKPDNSVKEGFKIGPKDGNYLLSFTDEDFTQLLGKYLRKETLEFLNKGE
jgi:V/A-type H+-transporting ATPase subunit E